MDVDEIVRRRLNLLNAHRMYNNPIYTGSRCHNGKIKLILSKEILWYMVYARSRPIVVGIMYCTHWCGSKYFTLFLIYKYRVVPTAECAEMRFSVCESYLIRNATFEFWNIAFNIIIIIIIFIFITYIHRIFYPSHIIIYIHELNDLY